MAIRRLDKPDWNIDSNVAYTVSATVPSVSSGSNALEVPLDAVPGGYFISMLKNLVNEQGAISAYMYIDRAGLLSGDISTSLVFKELGDNPYLSIGYKASIVSSPLTLDLETYPHDILTTASTSNQVQIIELKNTSDEVLLRYPLKEFLYTPGSYAQLIASYYNDTEGTRIVLERLDGSDYKLLAEVCDKTNTSNTPNGVKGSAGLYVVGDAGGNEAGAAILLDVVNTTNEVVGESYIVSSVIEQYFSDSIYSSIVISKSSDITESYVSATDPTGATSDVLRIENIGLVAENIEIIIPVIDFISDEVEFVFKPSALPINIYFKHRIKDHADVDFYFNAAEISAIGDVEAEIYRAEQSDFGGANAQLVHIDPNVSGGSVGAGNWIGIKSSIYNSEFVRSRMQYNNIVSPASFGIYQTLIDIADVFNGTNSTYLDLYNKAGVSTIVVSLQPSQYIDVYKVKREYL